MGQTHTYYYVESTFVGAAVSIWNSARPLRIERPDGRYPVTTRDNERKAIYREDGDRVHFLERSGRE